MISLSSVCCRVLGGTINYCKKYERFGHLGLRSDHILLVDPHNSVGDTDLK